MQVLPVVYSVLLAIIYNCPGTFCQLFKLTNMRVFMVSETQVKATAVVKVGSPSSPNHYKWNLTSFKIFHRGQSFSSRTYFQPQVPFNSEHRVQHLFGVSVEGETYTVKIQLIELRGFEEATKEIFIPPRPVRNFQTIHSPDENKIYFQYEAFFQSDGYRVRCFPEEGLLVQDFSKLDRIYETHELAGEKRTYQSGAVDNRFNSSNGNNKIFLSDTVRITGEEKWWAIDLESIHVIRFVDIYVKSGSVSGVLRDIRILVSSVNSPEQTTPGLNSSAWKDCFHTRQLTTNLGIFQISCNLLCTGRYLAVYSSGAPDLEFSEVEIFQQKRTNHALHKPAAQSSTLGNLTAAFATDGLVHSASYFMHTVIQDHHSNTLLNERNHWWMVDLQSPERILILSIHKVPGIVIPYCRFDGSYRGDVTIYGSLTVQLSNKHVPVQFFPCSSVAGVRNVRGPYPFTAQNCTDLHYFTPTYSARYVTLCLDTSTATRQTGLMLEEVEVFIHPKQTRLEEIDIGDAVFHNGGVYPCTIHAVTQNADGTKRESSPVGQYLTIAPLAPEILFINTTEQLDQPLKLIVTLKKKYETDKYDHVMVTFTDSERRLKYRSFDKDLTVVTVNGLIHGRLYTYFATASVFRFGSEKSSNGPVKEYRIAPLRPKQLIVEVEGSSLKVRWIPEVAVISYYDNIYISCLLEPEHIVKIGREQTEYIWTGSIGSDRDCVFEAWTESAFPDGTFLNSTSKATFHFIAQEPTSVLKYTLVPSLVLMLVVLGGTALWCRCKHRLNCGSVKKASSQLDATELSALGAFDKTKLQSETDGRGLYELLNPLTQSKPKEASGTEGRRTGEGTVHSSSVVIPVTTSKQVSHSQAFNKQPIDGQIPTTSKPVKKVKQRKASLESPKVDNEKKAPSVLLPAEEAEKKGQRSRRDSNALRQKQGSIDIPTSGIGESDAKVHQKQGSVGIPTTGASDAKKAESGVAKKEPPVKAQSLDLPKKEQQRRKVVMRKGASTPETH